MQQAQITPKFLNPRSEKGGANINDGMTKWFCPDNALQFFQIGMPANVTYEPKVSKSGRPYHVLLSVNGQPLDGNMQPVAQAAPVMAPPVAAGAPQYVPPQAPVQNIPTTTYSPPLPAPKVSESNFPTPEENFVKDVVAGAMGSGSFTITDIRHLAKEATHAWRERDSVQAGGPNPDDDPIPF